MGEEGGGKVDDLYLENLDEWILEEEKVITYKSLSKNLKVHVNVAKQMLFNYVKTKVDVKLGLVYLVSGLIKDDKYQDDEATISTTQKVLLVKEKDLVTVKSKFTEILSEHIYSVQKSSENINVTPLFLADHNPQEDPSTTSSLAAIKHKNAVPREAIVPRIIPKKEIKPEPKVVKEEKKAIAKKPVGIEAAFSKSSSKSSPVKNEASKNSNPKPVKSGGKDKPSIASMFAKQSSKPKPSKTDAEEKENIVNQKIEAKTNNDKIEEDDVKSKANTVKSKQSKVSNSKSKTDDSKKRKRIQVMSDSEDDDDDKDNEDDNPNDQLDEDAPPVSKLIESDDEEIPATPVQEKVKSKLTGNSKPGRRRVKKLVDKTYMDDKGYFVTKKEYESASETDDEPEQAKKPNTPKKEEKVEPPATKKPKLAGSGGKGQAGIMNFFKKK